MLFADLGDGGLFQEMLAQNLDFLFRTELSAVVGFVGFVVVAHMLFRSGKVS
jgi:uncharacterized membrane protein YeiH